ncbi:hypothetical protein DMB66_30020 [Actinoplanes sp. ATCC 53533]|nr:hypothetical protein DMB66_30020 [Actinoplanes sp. ATCC 53533]
MAGHLAGEVRVDVAGARRRQRDRDAGRQAAGAGDHDPGRGAAAQRAGGRRASLGVGQRRGLGGQAGRHRRGEQALGRDHQAHLVQGVEQDRRLAGADAEGAGLGQGVAFRAGAVEQV